MMSPHLFAASFLGQSACALLAAFVLSFVKIPLLTNRAAEPARSLLHITLTPQFIVAVACGIVSYGMMNMVMTSAPLAMVDCGHSVTDSALGIQWHVIAMYGPSFFTGHLINRFGVERIVAAGLGALLLAAGVGIAGITVAHFWSDLILLGLGWNFAFIGATTMVTRCHRPHERNKVQAFNDFLVFGTMAVTSFSSGQLLARFGWSTVNEVVFPAVLIAGGLLAWLTLRERAKTA
jgi:cyanate permease